MYVHVRLGTKLIISLGRKEMKEGKEGKKGRKEEGNKKKRE